ncbi:hypothetical protein B0181_11060 [Moraxella caviae]|uniref:Large polyvalent protein-associated domain-containing protein n=1 Tax=Moraxella caviae TaxID=34060 RepID=A0A1S9ZUN4_9GAMM|nr:LPD7 domain-containing protein [Moraxella caviae]OOR87107.1 hypothetical protein B0181_11060 [Moraxella caviae]STZ13638.1 Uncharacterised protein [Moraxella caviae]VEW10598.1 Uncharacterised protein [Moraxella caviae]
MAEPEPKTTTGTIIRHGEAPYQHDPNNSTNYFVEVEIEKDKFETLWGVQLKELVENQQLEVGEKVSFHKFKQEAGANRWEAARFFEAEKLENSVERDFEQEKVADQASELGQSKVKQSADYGTDDAEYIVPNAIRNRYLSVAVNKYTDSPMVKFYERENPASVAFEDRGDKGLHTSKSDKDTVTAMLDMAQSKGWESIKLKGSEDFKREAWMEAQMRGIKTKGYEPSEKDKLELQARQAERTSNQIEATKIGTVYTKSADQSAAPAEQVTEPAHTADQLPEFGQSAQAAEDEVSQDPQAAGYLKGWDYDTEAGKAAYSHWLAVMQAEKNRGVSEVEMSDYISSLQERIRAFDMDADAKLTDEVLYEKYHEGLENGEISASMSWEDYRDDWREAFAEADREAEIQAAEQHRDLKKVETEAYVRAEEFQRGRDIDPDLDMNVAGEAERFKTDVVAAPKVAGMTQAKVTQKVEAAFDRKIDGSMAAAKRDDFKKDFEENKAKLNDNDKVKVEAVRRILDYLHKDNPKELQASYDKLNTAMKNGEISKLPDVPQQVVQQSIEIQAPTQSNKDRGR